jgi:hypothetical protein
MSKIFLSSQKLKNVAAVTVGILFGAHMYVIAYRHCPVMTEVLQDFYPEMASLFRAYSGKT